MKKILIFFAIILLGSSLFVHAEEPNKNLDVFNTLLNSYLEQGDSDKILPY